MEPDGMTRIEVYLPPEAAARLEELRVLSGRETLAETIRDALKRYLVEADWDGTDDYEDFEI